MNEDLLTKVPVTILGVQDRVPLLKAFESEGYFPEPGEVWLVCGKAKVDAVLGKGWCNEVTALRKYKQQKAQRRSAWEPYCVRNDDRWVVTCLHPDAVRKSQWKLYPSLIAAVRWSIHLAKGGHPYTGGHPLNRPQEWK